MPNKEITIRDLYELQEKMSKQMNHLEEKIESKYVTQVEFEPIKKLVYGVTGAIIMAIVGAIMTLILKGV